LIGYAIAYVFEALYRYIANIRFITGAEELKGYKILSFDCKGIS